MKMKYAPRPWTYTQGDRNNPNNGRVTAANGKLLVLRATMNPDDQDVMRLFSAAPELLEALKLLLPVAQAFEKQASKGIGGRRGGPVFTKSRAAIAKATGQ